MFFSLSMLAKRGRRHPEENEKLERNQETQMRKTQKIEKKFIFSSFNHRYQKVGRIIQNYRLHRPVPFPCPLLVM